MADAAGKSDRAPGRVHVRLEAGAEPVLTTADRDAVVRVLENLLSNAERYATSCVTIDVRTALPWAVLTVSDDGPGIPAADRARVFERFARLDEARDRDRAGAGLGLSIVAGVVTRHQGTVVVDTDPDLGGARFVVNLPTATAQPRP